MFFASDSRLEQQIKTFPFSSVFPKLSRVIEMPLGFAEGNCRMSLCYFVLFLCFGKDALPIYVLLFVCLSVSLSVIVSRLAF